MDSREYKPGEYMAELARQRANGDLHGTGAADSRAKMFLAAAAFVLAALVPVWSSGAWRMLAVPDDRWPAGATVFAHVWLFIAAGTLIGAAFVPGLLIRSLMFIAAGLLYLPVLALAGWTPGTLGMLPLGAPSDILLCASFVVGIAAARSGARWGAPPWLRWPMLSAGILLTLWLLIPRGSGGFETALGPGDWATEQIQVPLVRLIRRNWFLPEGLRVIWYIMQNLAVLSMLVAAAAMVVGAIRWSGGGSGAARRSLASLSGLCVCWSLLYVTSAVAIATSAEPSWGKEGDELRPLAHMATLGLKMGGLGVAPWFLVVWGGAGMIAWLTGARHTFAARPTMPSVGPAFAEVLMLPIMRDDFQRLRGTRKVFVIAGASIVVLVPIVIMILVVVKQIAK